MDLTDLAPQLAERKAALSQRFPKAHPGAIEALLIEDFLSGHFRWAPKPDQTREVLDRAYEVLRNIPAPPGAGSPSRTERDQRMSTTFTVTDSSGQAHLVTRFSPEDEVANGLVRTGNYHEVSDTGFWVPEYGFAEGPTEALPSLPDSPAPPGAGLSSHTERAQKMSTMSTPALTAPAHTANGQAMRQALDERKAVGFGDRLRSLPRRMRAWWRSQIERLRDSSLGQAASRLSGRLLGYVKRVLGGSWTRGLVDLFGALLTCSGGRRLLAKAATVTYKAVAAPIRWAWKPVSWLLRKIGGAKVADWVEGKARAAERFVVSRAVKAMAWMDEREHSGLMRSARIYFQAGVLSNAIKGLAPAKARTPLRVASVLVPQVGVAGYKNGLEPSPLVKLFRELRDDEPTAKSSHGGLTVVPEATPKPASKVDKAPAYRATDGTVLDVEIITDADGDRWVKFDGLLYALTDLPDGWSVGQEAADRIAAAKATADREALERVAAASGAAPLNRTEKRNAARAHGPSPKR